MNDSMNDNTQNGYSENDDSFEFKSNAVQAFEERIRENSAKREAIKQEELEKAKKAKEEEEEKKFNATLDQRLVIEAATNVFWTAIGGIEYFITWGIAYPILLFLSVLQLQDFFQIFSKDPEIFQISIGFSAGAIAFYYIYSLFVPFVTTEHDFQFYYNTRETTRFNLVIYFFANCLTWISVNKLRYYQFYFNATFFLKLAVFICLYIVMVGIVKWYYQGLFAHIKGSRHIRN